MILAAAWAPFIENFGSLFKYLQRVLSYTVPPVVALFLVGIFWNRANARGAFAALVVGFLAGGALFIANEVLLIVHIHFLYVALILFLLAIPVIVVVSLMTPPPPEEKTKDLTWGKRFYDAESRLLKEVAWYKNYRILSVVLLVLTALMVITFW